MVGLRSFFPSSDDVGTRFSDSWQSPVLSHLPGSEAVLDNVNSRSIEQQRMDEVDEFVQRFHSRMPRWAKNMEIVKGWIPEEWPEELLPHFIWNEEDIARATIPQNNNLVPTEMESDEDIPKEELAGQLAVS